MFDCQKMRKVKFKILFLILKEYLEVEKWWVVRQLTHGKSLVKYLDTE
jgi:hypothetical protein